MKEQDLRLKLSEQTHSTLRQLASAHGSTMQDYVEKVLSRHCARKLDIARAIVTGVEIEQEGGGRPQWIYFVRRGMRGPVKIGTTSNIPARMRTLRTGCAEQLTVIGEFPASDSLTERAVHEKFDHLRLEGEWFKNSPEIEHYIAGLKQAS